jgi:hypothetical protein
MNQETDKVASPALVTFVTVKSEYLKNFITVTLCLSEEDDYEYQAYLTDQHGQRAEAMKGGKEHLAQMDAYCRHIAKWNHLKYINQLESSVYP